MAVFALLLTAVLMVVLATVVGRARRVTARDVAWLAGSAAVPDDEARVYRLYLARHRTRRVLGGLAGVGFAVVVGVRWYGTVRAGVGGASPLADVLFCALAGTVVGALSAETYRLRRLVGPAVASLAPRSPGPRGGLVRTAWAVAGAAVAVGLGCAVATGRLGALLMAVATALLVGVAAFTLRAVRRRRRVVDDPRAAAVDARLRAFAGETVAWLALAAAALGAGWTCAFLPWSGGPAWVGPALAVGSLAVTGWALHRASPRPPRSFVAGGAWAGVVGPEAVPS
ncbi:hypothetical protein GCM10025864_16980 [Luteimicrobium album]|uniref:Uncharacterized protein n=1 Tax=Luteimicrobium album TaxID=1054550 RepID=A0ABQ6I1V9_9MICO|nr:hypothetical protein [Luteimicrobium album]GMA23939.1 hypothetical protein GCM10025864_16980 [Luteimicrobium album]